MTIELNITEYNIDKKNIESYFTFTLKNDTIEKKYLLKTPLNPLLDIEILKLFDLNIKKKILKIKDIIKNETYSYKTLEALKDFMNWININTNDGNNLLL